MYVYADKDRSNHAQEQGPPFDTLSERRSRRRASLLTGTLGLRAQIFWSWIALVTTAGLASGGSAAAQSAAPASTAMGEVVVTAEKRTSTVSRTPISITAVTGRDLQARGIASFEQLAQETPGVSLRTSGPGQTEIEMRGLSSSGGSSPTVGFYLDETPITPPAVSSNGKVVIDPNLYDLDRAEVLRGPQGTLYGAGSMGGTVRLITNQPKLGTYSASAEGILSGTDGGGLNHGENLMANLPIYGDVLALRVVGTDAYRSGWIDRVVLDDFPLERDFAAATSAGATPSVRGDVAAAPVAKTYKDANSAKTQSLRASLLFQPNDRLSLTPSILYQNINAAGMDLYDSNPGRAVHYQPFDVHEPFSDSFGLASLVGRYDFGPVQLTNSLAYWSRRERQTQDAAENLQDTFGEPEYVPNAASTEIGSSRQVSEEIRLTSTSAGPLQWLVGYFYSNFRSKFFQTVQNPAYADIYGLDADVFTGAQPTEITQNAGFGQASYAVTSALKLTAGLRYFNYKTSVVSTTTGLFSSPDSSGRASASGVNPMANLSYTPRPGALVYVTAAKGFRPGGANLVVPASACEASLAAIGRTSSPLQYAPDSLWSYEAGAKVRLLGGRLSVNGDVYYEDWGGVQQQVALSCGFNFTANAASARIYGTEVETVLRLTPTITVTESLGYTHAALSSVSANTGFYVGERLQDVPAWTSSTSLQYTRPLGSGVSLVGRLTNDFVGSRTDVSYGTNTLPGYDIVNARAGFTTDKWSAYLFVNNLTNKHAELSDNNSLSVNIATLNRIATNQPLTAGVELSHAF